MLLKVAGLYAHLYIWFKRRFDRNLRGLGWLLGRVRKDAVLHADGIRFHFDHRIAVAYGTLAAGYCNEPETPAFVAATLDLQDEPTVIVDVGASIGDIALRLAGHRLVTRVLAFEANPIAATALRRSVQLNGWSNVQVFEEIVGDGEEYGFAMNTANPTVSGITSQSATRTRSVRLDDYLASVNDPLIMIIDVEGAEPIVLRGAAQTIARLRPLIVFEYNDVSRRHYSLNEIRDILGDDYEILRLTHEAKLDDDCEHAWNCVARPRVGATR